MFAKTPPSTSAKPFTPKPDMLSSCHSFDSFQMLCWLPVIVTNALQAAAAPDDGLNMLHSSDLNDPFEEHIFIVKNTFITVEDGSRMEGSKLFRSSSAPSILLSCPFKPRAMTMMELHDTGKCSPCAFFYREKGCRMGLACNFCHMCSPEELSMAYDAKKASTRARLLRARKSFKARKALM